ncbi:MAG: hypothetical protein WKF47_12665 [Geodermatophilaceae bacterium]
MRRLSSSSTRSSMFVTGAPATVVEPLPTGGLRKVQVVLLHPLIDDVDTASALDAFQAHARVCR